MVFCSDSHHPSLSFSMIPLIRSFRLHHEFCVSIYLHFGLARIISGVSTHSSVSLHSDGLD